MSLEHQRFGRNNSAVFKEIVEDMCLCHCSWGLKKPRRTILPSRILLVPTETEKMLFRLDFTNPRHHGRRNFCTTLTGLALAAM